MALDGFFLSSIIRDLSEDLIGKKVEKIAQPEKDEIILYFKINRKNKGLLISSSSNYPRIHFTDIKKENPLKPPMFCMVLRKYLKGAKIQSIEQVGTDRIVKINFISFDELGFESEFSLIIEIMGRHSNISLVRISDNVIMDCIKHISPAKNSYRSVMSGLKYVYPPKSELLNPYNFTLAQLSEKIRKIDDLNDRSFSKIFTGFSAELSKEIFFRAQEDLKHSTDQLSQRVISIINDFKDESRTFNLYTKDGSVKAFHCINFKHLLNLDFEATEVDSCSELLETFYYKKDLQDRMHNKTSDISRLVSNNIDRCEKKIKILNKTISDSHKKDKYRLYGELLTSFIYSIEEGSDKAKVLNYYVTDKEEYITIPLDPNKTVSENVQKYYKRYNKMKTSEEMASQQLIVAKDELEYLNSIVVSISNCTTTSEIDEVKKELVESGYLKKKNKGKKKEKELKSSPIHYRSSEGVDIYVGKNNIQNDYLTLKFASKNDIWLHTKEIPGSHVIIKNNGSVGDATLSEAANLAAFYSKAKDSTKVPVDYTEVKNVKKPSGSKPGMVIYYTNKTFYIDPVEPKIEKIC